MTDFLAFARRRVLLLDGAMGSQLQARELTLDDYRGQENCSEILNLSRPDLIRDIHRRLSRGRCRCRRDQQLRRLAHHPGRVRPRGAGARDQPARRASWPARRSKSFAGDGRERFVVGAIGPGTKLPSLGHIGYRELEDAFAVQAEGLIAGGVDALLIETCQDPLQIKAAVNGCRHAFVRHGRELPIMVQVTIETTGTMLVGTDIAAAIAIVDALGVPVMGLNCATGPKEMAEHVRQLSQIWRGLISVPAQRRPARAALRPHPLPAEPGRARRLDRALHRRGRHQHRRRLLRHHGRAHRRARRHAAPDGRGRLPAAGEGAPPAARAVAGLPVHGGAAAPGERLSWPSASAATPTARRNSASCRRPGTGTAASPWAASRCARAATRSTSAPPSSAATRWPR